MITELLGLAGSGIIGSVFGVVSDIIQRKQERKARELELKTMQEARLHGQMAKHLAPFASSPAFGYCVGMLCATYCACAVVCFLWPDVPIQTFNPDDVPKKLSLLWGFFSWERDTTKVYTITSGGVGFVLLHPVAFQIGSVITGIKASK